MGTRTHSINVEYERKKDMMTLDQAIDHALEAGMNDGECGAEHSQLAEWLTELRDLRAQISELKQGNPDLFLAAQVEPTVPTIRFGDWQCSLSFCCYGNDRTAIRLLDVADGSPVAVATVNIPEAELGDNEVIIKDYSENEGILDSLVAAGVVQDTGKRVRSGFITAPVCELLVKVPDQDHLERA